MLAGCSLFTSPPKEITLAQAAAYPADDHLFLLSKNYNVTDTAKKHRPKDGIGILDWTPGESLANLVKFLNIADVSFIRVHLINNTCIRNRSCGPYEIGYGYTLESFNKALLDRNPKIIKFIKDRTRVYKDLQAAQFPALGVAISPILEGNESDAAYEVAADAVKDVWPEVQLVNSKMDNNGKRYRGAWIECHGNIINKTCDIISTDGQEIMDINSAKWMAQKAGTVIKLRWSRTKNCRDQGKLLDPRRRTNCETGREAEQVSHSTDAVVQTPKQAFICTTKGFSGEEALKPLSEDKGTGDVRANLPVLLASMGKKDVSLVTYDGKRVGTLGYYGGYKGSINRYYSGYGKGSKKTGYEFQQEAVRLSKSPWVWAKQGTSCKGPFVPGRRQGNMR